MSDLALKIYFKFLHSLSKEFCYIWEKFLCSLYGILDRKIFISVKKRHQLDPILVVITTMKLFILKEKNYVVHPLK